MYVATTATSAVAFIDDEERMMMKEIKKRSHCQYGLRCLKNFKTKRSREELRDLLEDYNSRGKANNSINNNNTKTIASFKMIASSDYTTNYLKPTDQKMLKLILVTMALMMVAISFSECIKRTQYHEQGVHGPHSYKFGFTSGDHKNPQERHEVSDSKGHVKGWYSYKDPHGKMMVFHYEADPKKGFKVHKHKKHHYKKA